MLWIPFTIAGAAAQVVRNGMQASLTGKIGTLGATQVRFVFGLPFAVLFLLLALLGTGESLPSITSQSLIWALCGAVVQIGGTALMLLVMHRRAFSVAYAYLKTEPAIVALLGVIFLGDLLPWLSWMAILIVTAGVLVASVKWDEWSKLLGERGMIAAGLASAVLFSLSAISFRGAITALGDGSFLMRSMTSLVMAQSIQVVILGLWLALFDRAAFTGSVREWRSSSLAGFFGALASAFWFLAFSLTAVANVRTLALVEMPMVALWQWRTTGKMPQGNELAGLAVVTLGVLLLFLSAAT